MQLNYLETVWFFFFFQILLLSLVRQNQNRIFSKVNSASQMRQNPSWYFSQCPMISEAFQSGCWKQESFLALHEPQEFFLLIFSLSVVLDFFFTCRYWWELSWRLKEDPLQISRALSPCIALSFPVAGLWIVASLPSHLHLLNSGDCWVLPGLPLPATWPGISLGS